MVNKQRLDDALDAYTGQPDTLNNFATVAEQELGENWTSTIYDILTGLDAARKEKLDHVYYYYGATLAWGEIQGYLAQEETLDIQELNERIPTLEYWLTFFGDEGKKLVDELKTVMHRQMQQVAPTTTDSTLQVTAPNVQENGADLPEIPDDVTPVNGDEILETSDNSDIDVLTVQEEDIFEQPIQEEPREEDIFEQPMQEEPREEDIFEQPMQEEPREEDIFEQPMQEEPREEDIFEQPMQEEPREEDIFEQQPKVTSQPLNPRSATQSETLNNPETLVQQASTDEQPSINNETIQSEDYPIDNQQHDENGYPIDNQQYDENGYPIDNQQYDENGYPIDNQQYDENGYPIDNQQYDENGYPIDNQQYDENGYPIDNQQYDENGYPIDNQQYDENGYPIDNQQYDENGYPIDNQQYDENGYPIDNQQYDNNPVLTGVLASNNAGINTQLPTGERIKQTEKYQPEKPETNEQFLARKAFKQIDFINLVHSWMDARCIGLGNIEIYNYKHYGFLIDAMEQAKKDIQEVLASPAYYPAIEATRPNGLQTLQNSLVALEKDLEVAYDNAQSETTSLIHDEIDTDEARRMLGMVDTTNRKEYLGPAPDGFEMIDDPFDDANKV